MQKTTKKMVTMGISCFMVIGILASYCTEIIPKTTIYAATAPAPGSQVEVKDLVIKFLGIPEYEPNRYGKSLTGPTTSSKWMPDELERAMLITASMKLGEGNPEGMMAPLKTSFGDILADETFDVKTGDIQIVYNGLTLKMKAGSNTATLTNATTTKTLTFDQSIAPYFYAIPGEIFEDGSQYYACYLPVKFTFEALGANVIWNEQMHRLEGSFAFYYSDAAVAPVLNSDSAYTTGKIEKNNASMTYATMSGKLTGTSAAANVSDMITAGLAVVDPRYQNDDGGWGKTNAEYDLLNPTFAKLCTPLHSTFDNGTTHGQIKFLARLLKIARDPANATLFNADPTYQSKLDTIEAGFWKAVKYILDAQMSNGGWTQYYPYSYGYYNNITLNDGAMPTVMQVLFALTNDTGLTDSALCNDFSWARGQLKTDSNLAAVSSGLTFEKVQACFDKSVNLTLDLQVKINGVLTGWAQQYDNNTLKPSSGRAYELPTVSSQESKTVVAVLMNINNPSQRIKDAIKSFAEWYPTVGFKGYVVMAFPDRTRELGTDKLMIKDPANTDLITGRFYGIDTTGTFYGLDISKKLTSSPYYEITAGRDTKARFDFNDGISERRAGYTFFYKNDANGITNNYNSWKTKLGL